MRTFIHHTLVAITAIQIVACSTAASPEDAAVSAATQRYVKANSGPGVGAVKVEVQKVAEGYARAYITPVQPTTDPATVYLRKNAKGQWEGLSLGTGFSPEDLDELGVPASVRE